MRTIFWVNEKTATQSVKKGSTFQTKCNFLPTKSLEKSKNFGKVTRNLWWWRGNWRKAAKTTEEWPKTKRLGRESKGFNGKFFNIRNFSAKKERKSGKSVKWNRKFRVIWIYIFNLPKSGKRGTRREEAYERVTSANFLCANWRNFCRQGVGREFSKVPCTQVSKKAPYLGTLADLMCMLFTFLCPGKAKTSDPALIWPTIKAGEQIYWG